MLSSSSVIKNSKVIHQGNKEIVTDSSIEDKKQSISDIENILKENSKELFDGVDKIANAIIENAKSQAEALKKNAFEEAKKIQKEAYEEAYKKGHEEGYKKAYEETFVKGKMEVDNYKSLAENNASNLMYSAKYNYEKYLKEKQESIKELALTIAEHILKREVKNEDGVNDMIYNVLEESKNNELIIVKCSKIHYKAVSEAAVQWKNTLPLRGELTVIEDSFLEDGSAIVEKNNGKVKVGIDIGFNKIVKELLKN